MHAGLEIHNACLRKCIADNHGYEVKTVGDSFVVAFHNVVDAAAFMLSAQHALLQQPWSEALLRLPNCQPTTVDTDQRRLPNFSKGEAIPGQRGGSKEQLVADPENPHCAINIGTQPCDVTNSTPWLWAGLRVRMGCHVGIVDREYVEITGRVDYFGPPVNMAARVESMAHGGEILVSEACFEVLRDTYPESLTCLGSFFFA